MEGLPEGVCFGEAVFDFISWESGLDVGFCAAAVAGMAADALAEEFFHGRHKGMAVREVETREGDLCGGETAG